MNRLELHASGTAAIRPPSAPAPVAASAALALLVALVAILLAPAGGSTERAAAPAPENALAGLPMSFAPERGGFVARGPGYDVALGSDGAAVELDRPGGDAPRTLAMRFAGGRPDVPLAGAEKLPGTVNDFTGEDPSRWRAAIPTYGAVRAEPWPGISAQFGGDQGELRYDFFLAPRADPSLIRLDYEGASALRIDRSGDLVVSMPGGGEVTQSAPVAFQRADGAREPVESGFRLLGGDRIGVAVGDYDRTRRLVIDPTLSYSTYLGGAGIDAAAAVAVDGDGSVYLTGRTTSADYPTANAFQGALDGPDDAFVTKLNPAGTAIVYSTYLGGSATDVGNAIAVDAAGSAYVAGTTSSLNFPTTPGAFQSNPAGAEDVFVTRLNPAGSALTYSTYLGGSASDFAAGVALDASGSAYVTGQTNSANLPTTAGAFQPALDGGFDSFATKLNTGGSALVYSTFLGGADNEGGGGIAVDAGGGAHVVGSTRSDDFPTANAIQPARAGDADGFVARLNASGTALDYSTYMGGSGFDRVGAVALDGSGSAYLAGQTASADFPTEDPLQPALAGLADAFVAKLTAAGSAFAYATYLGGADVDAGRGVAVDAAGALHVAGGTLSSDFPTLNPLQPSLAGSSDAFAATVNPAGSALGFSTYLGGSADDFANGIALDQDGDAYLAGPTSSSDFPTANAVQATFGGVNDAFVAKIATPPSATALSCSPQSLEVGASSTCTATVTDTDAGSPSAPTGTVSFASDAQGSFAPGASCALAAAGAGTSRCSVDYAPGAVGTHAITATYAGPSHEGSASAPAELAVSSGETPVDPVDPVDPVNPPDTVPPTVKLIGKARQELGGRVTVKALSNEDGTAAATGVLGVRAGRDLKEAKVKRFNLKPRTRTLAAGAKTPLVLKLTNSGKKTAKRALRRDGRAKARLRVEVSDEAGNETLAKFVVELRPN